MMSNGDPSAIDALRDQAYSLHRDGDLAAAERAYRELLRLAPDALDAKHGLGILALQTGRNGLAVELLTAVTKARQSSAACFYLGVALAASARYPEAVDQYDRALALEPGYMLAYLHRGQALRCLSRPTEALASFGAAMAIAPDDADVLMSRAALSLELRYFDQVLADCERVAGVRPDLAAEILRLRAAALVGLERFDEALHGSNERVALLPGCAEALVARAHVLQQLNRSAEALADCVDALAIEPRLAYAHFLSGVALRELKRTDEALLSFENAVRLEPHNAKAKFEIAWLNLLSGRFDTGWEGYRKWGPAAQSSKASRLAEPVWDGSQTISGKVLFLHADQGLGDTIQFSRYARIAEARGAKVVLSVQDGLGRLMRGLGPSIDVRERSEAPPDFDLHCALPDLPGLFGTTLSAVPATVPYLTTEPDLVELWGRRLGVEGFKIGVCWKGSRANDGRSFPLPALQRISTIPGIRLISLQKFDRTVQPSVTSMNGAIESWGEDLDAGPDKFLDTAAVIKNLDLVISCDTSVVHLAGALGHAAWVVLKYVPDWRWLLERSDSPWYPTLTLFRQSAPGVWDDVFDSMYETLAAQLA